MAFGTASIARLVLVFSRFTKRADKMARVFVGVPTWVAYFAFRSSQLCSILAVCAVGAEMSAN